MIQKERTNNILWRKNLQEDLTDKEEEEEGEEEEEEVEDEDEIEEATLQSQNNNSVLQTNQSSSLGKYLF